jgi:hypothetical protein
MVFVELNFWLKSDKSNRHFMFRATYIYDVFVACIWEIHWLDMMKHHLCVKQKKVIVSSKHVA